MSEMVIDDIYTQTYKDTSKQEPPYTGRSFFPSKAADKLLYSGTGSGIKFIGTAE